MPTAKERRERAKAMRAERAAPSCDAPRSPSPAHAVLEEAGAAGLLEGGKGEHVNFRAPPALIEAGKREAGVGSTIELGLFAPAILEQPDPVVSVLRRTRGRLGRNHQLAY